MAASHLKGKLCNWALVEILTPAMPSASRTIHLYGRSEVTQLPVRTSPIFSVSICNKTECNIFTESGSVYKVSGPPSDDYARVLGSAVKGADWGCSLTIARHIAKQAGVNV